MTLGVYHPPFLKFLAVKIKSEMGFAASLTWDDLSQNPHILKFLHPFLLLLSSPIPFFANSVLTAGRNSSEDPSLISNINCIYFTSWATECILSCFHGNWQLDHSAVGGLQPYKVLMMFVTESTGRRLSQTVWIRDELLGLKQGLKLQRKKIKTSYNIQSYWAEEEEAQHIKYVKKFIHPNSKKRVKWNYLNYIKGSQMKLQSMFYGG